MNDLYHQIDVEDLPGVLREMAGAIGVPATMTLVLTYGGTRLYVPIEANITPAHMISRLIGFELAVRLAQKFGGLRQGMEIPRAVEALRAVRNREIRAKRAMGKSRPELAREYGLTERAIDYIVASEPTEDWQERLF